MDTGSRTTCVSVLAATPLTLQQSQSFSPYPQQGYQSPPPNNYNQMQYQPYQQKPEYNNTPPPQQMAPYQAQQVASSQPQQPPAPPKKSRFGGGGMGGTLAHALVGGVGFGAGSAVGVRPRIPASKADSRRATLSTPSSRGQPFSSVSSVPRTSVLMLCNPPFHPRFLDVTRTIGRWNECVTV